MGTARASIRVPAQVSAAEALWYDTRRWASFVEGFAHVTKLEGEWPKAGSRVVWTSTPDGRGLVAERVTAYEVRGGQTVEVEDEKLTGTQSVAFRPAAKGGCEVTVEFRYALKDRNPLTPLVDGLFIRRAFGDALRRTLARFARELKADAELGI